MSRRIAPGRTESDFASLLLRTLGPHPFLRMLVRQQVGTAFIRTKVGGSDLTQKLIAQGVIRPFTLGAPKGAADWSGMVTAGPAAGRRIELELKSETGHLEPEQAHWRDWTIQHGGIHLVPTVQRGMPIEQSVAQAVEKLEELIDEAARRR